MAAAKISIVIPVYNAAAYIEQCIRSVLDQTMQDIEVIAVNDGSTDESEQLLNQIAATDRRLKVFHRHNQGVSTARNFGLQKATGEYIAFSDADDFMEIGMLALLYDTMQKNNCDFGICNVMLLKEGETPKPRLNLVDEVISIEGNHSEFVREMMRFRYDNANWNKLFTASIIRTHKLEFNREMYIYEDLLFNLQYTQFAKKVAIISQPLYNYRVLQNSLYGSNIDSRVKQFNRLFTEYLAFAQKNACSSVQDAFRLEMARATYNQFLYSTEMQVLQNSKSVIQVAKNYKKELLKFNPSLFYYPASQLKGVQGFKKRLLQGRHFAIFSLITALKPWARRPYKFFKRLMNVKP